jgi:outer membrane lipoprotein
VVKKMRVLMMLLSSLLLAACASTTPVDTGPGPDQISRSGVAEGAVHWGGRIVTLKNLRDRTLIEVLAYPLAANGRPLPEQPAQGRFIVQQAGFLEPREYRADRLLEVHGKLDGFTEGRVGDAPYRFPVVVADRLNLWEQTSSPGYSSSPRINFGIGVGTGGSGAGVGIGF